MFGIGFQELVLLSLIGLVVLGPERLPRVANQIGTWLGQARRMTRVMKRQLEDELNFEKDFDIKPPSREPSTQPTGIPNADDHFSAAHEVAASDEDQDDTRLPAAGGQAKTAGVKSSEADPDEPAPDEDLKATQEAATKDSP